MPLKRLENLLNSNADTGLGELIRHARNMGDLVQMLQLSLPDEMAGSVVAANIRDDGELVILVHSSAWASRLRFESEALMAAARESGARVTSCSVRVQRN